MQNNNDFAVFIDELRESRNITRETFVDGVISLRQYYRFIKGESSLKTDLVNKLLDKLHIDSIMTFESYRQISNSINRKLSNIYIKIYSDDFVGAKKDLKELDYSTFTSQYNKKFYKFIDAIIRKNDPDSDDDTITQEITEIIDYPNLLNKKTLSFVEVAAIMLVSKELVKKGDNRLAEYCYNLVKNDDSNIKHQINNYTFAFYSTTARNLGQIGKVEESYEVTKEGIKIFQTHEPLNSYAALYFFQALAERDLFDDNRHLEALRKMFMTLRLQASKQFAEGMRVAAKRSFDIEEKDLIIYK